MGYALVSERSVKLTQVKLNTLKTQKLRFERKAVLKDKEETASKGCHLSRIYDAVSAEAANYTCDTATGLFTTLAGQITVPAASYKQNADGTWTVTPRTSTLVITGTV